jgi:hypothetical protein
MMSAPRVGIGVLCALVLLVVWRAGAQSNGVLREVYFNIPGNAVSDLTGHPSFPASPGLETIQPTFEAPSEFNDNYGQRMRALVVPPMSGNYVFWIAADDGGALYLSTTEEPAQKVQIATVNTWTSSREWTKEPNQQSAAIALVSGQRYYIEALQKEGQGGDNLAVRWQLPLGSIEEPIPNHRLVVYGLSPPIISQQPANQTVTEGGTATFRVQLSRSLGAGYQWLRNGTNIPGANQSSYGVGPVGLADSGSRFSCYITNALGSTNTREAILTVLADTTRPTLVSVANLGDNEYVSVVFSEPLEEATATAVGNYALNFDANVLQANLLEDLRSVILRTTPLAVGTNYTLTVNNVRDRAATPNTIQTNSQRTFSLAFTPLDIGRVMGASEPIGPSSRRTGLVITEMMYHPTNRADGRNLEFVELYNSQEWSEDISGYRLTGEADYTFPPNTVMAARSFLVVAAVPGDIQAVYGTAIRVLGPFTNALSNGSGTVRLRNRLGAILLEANYDDEPPYPAAADGGGHSLVLARPSFGERDPRAWAASDRIGGSPGVIDPVTSHVHRTIVINEFLAHTDDPQRDFIELYNYGNSSVSLAGCVLTDDPETNKFVIPSGTSILPRGFVVFDQTQLGFALDAGGETIFLKNNSNSRIIDAVRFAGQANGVSTGRTPDGAAAFSPLEPPTSGAPTGRRLLPEVIINEIMYHAISGNSDDDWLEIYNPTTFPIYIEDWRLRGGIEYQFPNDTFIEAGAYVIVAKNRNQFYANYPGVNRALVFGNYDGNLANSGERIVLSRPEELIQTNDFGVLFTNTIHVVIDEVTYGTGGRWGSWSDGGGSSLERIDARADARLAGSWTDSDESVKSSWTTVEWTGVLDHGQGPADTLQLFQLGSGECLVDDVEVVPQGSGNVIANGSFNAGLSGWTIQGNQERSRWVSTGGMGGSPCLHVRASGRGDTGANRIWTPLTTAPGAGSTATLRAKVRWLKGSPEILLRLHGSWLEATTNIVTTRALGTPAAPNSRAQENTGPAIANVSHSPLLPAASQALVVSAQVSDSDALAKLQLKYRVDPSTNYTVASMVNNGAGFFSATIPGQAAGALVAFYIEAQDNFEPRAATRFPDDAPLRECLVRFGDTVVANNFGNYRFWITQATLDRWIARERLSNHALDTTFIYGNARVIYNVGAQYAGSPYHAPGYNSPLGNPCDYVLNFADDDVLLGDNDINLIWPGNGGGDGSLQREQTAYWLGYQLGLPYTHRRHVNVIINGVRRGQLLEDGQQPNRDMADQWYPEGEGGNLHKIQLWFEFDALASGFSTVGASLGNFTTTGGAKKLARYRWNWAARAFRETANNYTNLFALMDAATTGVPGEAYTRTIESAIDVDQWMRTFAVEHIVGNVDSWGYGGGQNMYTYKPVGDTWKLMIWDIDFAFAWSTPQEPLFGFGDGQVQRMADHPPFRRMYLRALADAANGPLVSSRADPVLDARYNAFVGANQSPENPSAIKSYISQRRTYILQQLAAYAASFTVQGTTSFTTNRNLITFSGTAPFEVEEIFVNGAAYRVTWTTVSNWTLRLALASGVNSLLIQGMNNHGQLVSGAQANLSIEYTGPNELPQDKLVINEIMYNPRISDAAYIEIFNTSAANAFDLTGYRLDGVDFEFADGAVIEPGSYLLVVKNSAVFAATYGRTIPIADEFPGNLNNGGETITLLNSNVVIDQVTYDDAQPWPTLADGGGPSLQLIDPVQDNDRVANWAAVSTTSTNPPQTLIRITNAWKFNQTGDLTGVNWTVPQYDDSGWSNGPALLYVEGSALPAPKSTPLTLGRLTYYFRTRFNLSGGPAGASLKINTVLDDGAVFYLNGQEIFRLGMAGGAVGYSTPANRGIDNAIFEGPFIVAGTGLAAGENVLAVEVHQTTPGSSDIVFGMTLETTYDVLNLYTPGAMNSVRANVPAFPSLWLNEVQPNNFFLGTNGLTDRFGDRDPWLELFNGSSNTISLTGYALANNFSNLAQWPFPAGASIGPGEFLVIWADGEAAESISSELHTSFRLATNGGSIILSRTNQIIDYLSYDIPNLGRSYGSYPDGRVSGRRTFHFVTPGRTNNPAAPPVNVFINEWMAANSGFEPDPVDGNFEDWFELYNASPFEADISDFYLTDTLTNKTKWKIPDGTIIPPHGFLIVWADEETEQNGATNQLHTNFRLGQGGEEIGLYARDGTAIDSVIFGMQTNNVSEGRFTDGQTSIIVMSPPTPGGPNAASTSNSAPALSVIGDRAVPEGSQLLVTCAASDPESPPQALRFELLPGAPSGTFIDPASGQFSWTPSEAQGPGVYDITVRVTDSGIPNMSDTETFTVIVAEVNNAPTLNPIGNRTVSESNTLTVTISASDPEAGQTLTFSLDPVPPEGMTINPMSGTITWMPGEGFGGGNYSVIVRVTDNGEPRLSDTKTLSLFVNEINIPPVVNPLPSRTIHAGELYQVTAAAEDGDLPAQQLSFILDDFGTTEATVDPATGVFTWTPQTPNTTNTFQVKVADNGAPPYQSVPVTFVLTVAAELKITHVGRDSGGLVLRWNTIPGRRYQLQYKDQLDAPEWTPLGEPQTASGGVLEAVDARGLHGQRFYSIRLLAD